MVIARISDIAKHVGQDVRLQGWLYNKRSSKKLQFLQVRDGSGIIQGIVSLEDVGSDMFALADGLTQEASVIVDGT
ncbi:MAG: asparagine--tRNA ligase, partial [Clostridia bacterium]|nr:asparagine--tRNA ligase [Deltaproteobacteria bacterium]